MRIEGALPRFNVELSDEKLATALKVSVVFFHLTLTIPFVTDAVTRHVCEIEEFRACILGSCPQVDLVLIIEYIWCILGHVWALIDCISLNSCNLPEKPSSERVKVCLSIYVVR